MFRIWYARSRCPERRGSKYPPLYWRGNRKDCGCVCHLKTASAAAGTVRSATSAIRGFASGVQSATSIIPKLVEGFSLIQGGAGTFSEVLTLEFPKIAGIATKIGGVFFWFRQCCPNWAFKPWKHDRFWHWRHCSDTW